MHLTKVLKKERFYTATSDVIEQIQRANQLSEQSKANPHTTPSVPLLYHSSRAETELAPSFQEAHQAYSEANYPLAIESFQKILETAGNDATSSMYYNLGCALYKDGQLAPAILQFSRAYRLAPSDADVRFNHSQPPPK